MKVSGISASTMIQKTKTGAKNAVHKIGEHFRENGGAYLGIGGLVGLVGLEGYLFSKLPPEDGISGVTGMPYPDSYMTHGGSIGEKVDAMDIAEHTTNGMGTFLEGVTEQALEIA